MYILPYLFTGHVYQENILITIKPPSLEAAFCHPTCMPFAFFSYAHL